MLSSIRYKELLAIICLKKQLKTFIKKFDITNWTINLKWPVHNSIREYFEMFSYSFYNYLVRKFQSQKHYKNTLRIFYLLSEYKDVKILSEHFAYELLQDKKRHTKILHSISAMLKIKEFFPKGVFDTIRIGIHGKINAKLRTKHYYMQHGAKPKNQSYCRPIHYHLAYSHAKTGVFGVHIWAQIARKQNRIE